MHVEVKLSLAFYPLLLHVSNDAFVHCLRCLSIACLIVEALALHLRLARPFAGSGQRRLCWQQTVMYLAASISMRATYLNCAGFVVMLGRSRKHTKSRVDEAVAAGLAGSPFYCPTKMGDQLCRHARTRSPLRVRHHQPHQRNIRLTRLLLFRFKSYYSLLHKLEQSPKLPRWFVVPGYVWEDDSEANIGTVCSELRGHSDPPRRTHSTWSLIASVC